MQIRVDCIFADESTLSFTECLHLTLIRDRYLPYASLSVRLPVSAPLPVPVTVRLYLGGQLVHEGSVRKCR